MTTLVLGINEVPYVNAPKPKKVAKASRRPRKAKAEKTKAGTQTTGDVATWLEEKYGVYAVFVASNKEAIDKALAESAAGSLETFMAGGPIPDDPFASAASEIDALFKAWLSSGAIERLGVAGVPTKASLERRSLRFKGKKSPAGRSSFIDSGLFEANFHSWVESR